ncbi:MAG: HAD family hydrolase [Christensenellales bacterium]
MIKAVFFDLDGTLLSLDMEDFVRVYHTQIEKSGFYKILGTNGGKAFSSAVYAMLTNNGRALNKDVFFETLYSLTKADLAEVKNHMDNFYANEFDIVKYCVSPNSDAIAAVALLKSNGYRLILATNPLFPPAATYKRIEWAGLSPDDFEYISHYENSRYCKPNPEYFKEALYANGLSAEECLFVGNDVRDDMCCIKLGFKGFLVTNHIIGDAREVPQCAKGDYSAFLSFAENLPRV